MLTIVLLILSYGILAVSVTVCLLIGRKKGVKKTLIAGAVTLGAAVLAFCLTLFLLPDVSRYALNLVSANMTGDLLDFVGASDSVYALVGVIACGVVLPIAFLVIYVLLQVVGSIATAVVLRLSAREGTKEDVSAPIEDESNPPPAPKPLDEKSERNSGMAIGAARGLVIALILSFPMLALFGLADTAVEQGSASEALLADYVGEATLEEIRSASDANILNLVFGQNLVKGTLSAMTSTELDGEKVNAYDGAEGLELALEAYAPLKGEKLNFGSLTEEQIEKLEEALDTVGESPLLSSVLADFVCECGGAWENGETYMGLCFPSDLRNGVLSGVFAKLNTVLAHSERDTVVPNLHTLFEALSVFGEIDVSVLNGGSRTELEKLCALGAFDRMIEPFRKNAEMEPVTTEIGGLGMWAVSAVIVPTAEDREAMGEEYEVLSEDVAALAVLHASDPEALTRELNGLVVEYGADVSESMVECVTDVLLAEQEELGRDLTKEDVMRLFEEYSEKQANG